MSRALFALAAVVCLVAEVRAQGSITITPAAMTFTYQIGASALPAAQTMQVQSSPQGLNFTAAVSGSPFNAAWLLASTSTGKAPTSVKVQVNPTGLPAGSYVGTITLTAVNGTTTITKAATVTLLVANAPPTVSATPASLNFNYITGSPIPSPSLSSAFILSSSGSALSATISVSGASWLTVAPTGDISLVGLFNTVSVTVNPVGLVPKVYTGTITIAAPAAVNKTLTVNVTLTVSAAQPTAISTWPPGVIQGSGTSTVTINGTSYFSNSTVADTGFTPASTITVTDGTSSASSTFLIPVYQATSTQLRLAVGSPLPNGTVGTAYSQALSAAGGTSPYAYSAIAGLMPPGLTISGSTISGTPSAAGTYLFTIQVTDSSTQPIQSYCQMQLTIDPSGSSVLRITTAATPLPEGIVGTSYGMLNLTATGGTGGPYTWSATNLPNGLSLSSSGVLSGTPSTDGSGGALAANVVSSSAALVTVPAADLATAGVLRMAVTTPAPGGGTSNEAQFQVYGPNPQITAVVNSASYQQGVLAPGDVITIFGLGLGPSALTVFDPTTPPIPTSLPATAPSTSVTINGISAPVVFTSATQIGVIVPYTITGTVAQVVVTFGTLVSQPFTVGIVPADPGIYATAASGVGQGAILNVDSTGNFTINSSSNPAPRNSNIVIYMTGAGTTTSAIDNQLIPATPPVTPVLTPTVTIGGQGAAVLSAQAAPGSVPGLILLTVTVPSTTPTGPAQAVVVTIGGAQSQAGLTMAVR